MTEFKMPIEVRWSDLDPNFHVRHSIYYDWGAYCRICFFQQHGLHPTLLTEHQLGPILFREECVFRKEIRFGDHLTIDLQLTKMKEDCSRWSIRHSIYKNSEILAAVLTVDGAWIDTMKRKLTTPPPVGVRIFNEMPKSPEFEWIKK